MAGLRTILLLEDEPLILMDLECAAHDLGCTVIPATSCAAALAALQADGDRVHVAVLDVSLGSGETCIPVAEELVRRSIPFILHSGNLDRHDEQLRQLEADLVAKPTPADAVIEAALRRCA